MKKMKVAVLIFMALAVSVILTQANPAAAGTYSKSQLDKGMVSDDLFPTINNQGQIVWFHAGCQFETGDPPDTYIYTETGKYLFYQGGSLTPLNIPTNSAYPANYYHAPPLLLNDRGQIGYVIQDYNDENRFKIYFNDGPGSSPQLASGSFPMKWDLQLNQQGQMAWDCYDANSRFQVYLFNNGLASPITNYNYSDSLLGFFSGLSLNDAGQVVWIDRTYDAANNLVHNIQLYQSGVTECIYSTYNEIFYTQINNQGQVVWVETEQVTGQYNIMLYDGGSAKHIPGGDGFPYAYFLQINNRGQVMWLGKKTDPNPEPNIYLYSNGSTTQVTHYTNDGTYNGIIDVYENYTDDRTKFAPHLNNNGEIVWVTRVPNGSNPTYPTYYDLAVQVYSGGQVTQLDSWTADPSMSSNWAGAGLHAVYAQINDAGQVTWCRYNGADVPDRNSDFEIYLATPVTLANAIKSLQVLTGMMNVPGAGDVTGDKRIGIEDVIYSLQSASGLRP